MYAQSTGAATHTYIHTQHHSMQMVLGLKSIPIDSIVTAATVGQNVDWFSSVV